MTVTELTLRNLKCFEALDLPCAPLTVLTGHNGAGKSTALQSLLLIAQGLRANSDYGELPLNGDLVALGTGRDVLRRNAKSLSLGARGGGESGECILCTFGYDSGLGRRGLLPLTHARYSARARPPLRLDTLRPALVSESRLLPALRDTILLSGDREVRFQSSLVPRSMSQIQSVGKQGDVGTEGEYAAYWYLECSDEEVDLGRRRRGAEDKRQTVRSQVDAWTDELFPGVRTQARRLDVASPIQLSFRIGWDSPWARPWNVGYGVAYAFPMIVSLLTAQVGSIIVIDSAEAHLHPRAQSAVGRILGQMAGAGLQIFVETHSDHLLNGVRLAVREGLVPPEDVAVHFFSAATDAGGAEVAALTLDRHGAIDSWPEGFFDQAEQDLSVLANWG